MKSKSIYYVCKQDGRYYSERRAIVYQNDKFTYIKRPGTKVLSYISTDSIHVDFNPNKVEQGYYLKKPNQVTLGNLSIYEKIQQSRARLAALYERRDTLSDELNSVSTYIANEEINLLNLIDVDNNS